ncbi:hypothetical protein E2320_004237, partial [Naja naja]
MALQKATYGGFDRVDVAILPSNPEQQHEYNYAPKRIRRRAICLHGRELVSILEKTSVMEHGISVKKGIRLF